MSLLSRILRELVDPNRLLRPKPPGRSQRFPKPPCTPEPPRDPPPVRPPEPWCGTGPDIPIRGKPRRR